MTNEINEKITVANYLQKNNLFLYKLINKSSLSLFFKNLNVYKTNLVRIGGDNDGGYLIPNDLEGIKYCFSPGVADSIAFEKDLAKKNITSFLIDYSIEKLPEENKLFEFKKKFLGIKNNEKFITINKWIKESSFMNSNTDAILQMDIEGNEYEVLLDFEEVLMKRFRILVIEFHQFYDLTTPFGHKIIQAVFDKILQNFFIVHIHPNNLFPTMNVLGYEIPNLLEFTFLRKDRLKDKAFIKSLPHDLDKKI